MTPSSDGVVRMSSTPGTDTFTKGMSPPPIASPMTPMTTLVAGPAAAMKNSAFAVGGSCRRFATPPNRNNVIDETDMLNRRATSECESSCARIEQKNRSAVMTAMRSRFCCDHAVPSNWPCQSPKNTRAKMISHEMCSLISMPKIRPMRNEPDIV